MHRFLLPLLLAWASACPAAEPQPPAPAPTAAAFAAGTTVRHPAISPDASRLALVVSHPGGEGVVVRPLAGGPGRAVYRFDDPDLAVAGLRWLDERRLLLRLVASARDFLQMAVTTHALLIVDAETGALTLPYAGGGVRVDWSNDRTRLVDQPRPSPDALLLFNAHQDGGEVIRIDTRSTLRTRAQRPIPQALAYWADAGGELRVLVRRDGEHSEMLLRQPEARGWKTVRRWQHDQPDALWLLGFDGDDRDHFLVRGRHAGQPALLRLDLRQPEADPQPLRSGPALADAMALLRHPGTGAVIGVSTPQGPLRWGDGLEGLEGGLRETLPGRSPRLAQWLGDDYLVITEGPTEPEQLWHGKRSAGTLSPLLSARPTLPQRLALRSERLRFGSLQVDLLRPPGDAKLPVVWCLECGLQRSEVGAGFNPMAAFLASRGWAVLQVRPVDGPGRTLMERARARDARLRPLLDHALAQPSLGLDARRIALIGSNLLGFDALRWAADEPQRFRAVVTLDALTDLQRYAALDREPISRDFRERLQRALADLDADGLRAASPVQHAAKLPAALLLVHGERSASVDAEHARALAEARRSAGLPVELMLLKNSSGEVLHAPYREQVLAAAEALLRKAFDD